MYRLSWSKLWTVSDDMFIWGIGNQSLGTGTIMELVWERGGNVNVRRGRSMGKVKNDKAHELSLTKDLIYLNSS